MKRHVTILLAEDDPGHASLIERNLRRVGIGNDIVKFENGQQIVDFLFPSGDSDQYPEQPYLVLLDLRMPRLDGIEVLRRIKDHPILKRLPVIMLSTTDDPREIARCYALGCSSYIVKPIASEGFVEAIRRLGLFLTTVEAPSMGGARND